MGTVSELTLFFEKMRGDPRIGTSHISLYMALFQLWNLNEFEDPIVFTSKEIMKMAKIDSRATYHKCLIVLVEYGYLRYFPSCNPLFKNLAYLKIEA